jgi:hypothetical protein
MRASLQTEHVSVRDFVPVLFANVLPLGGLAVPGNGVQLHSVYLLYWFELLTLFLVYCGCAMLAQREYVEEPEEPSLSASWPSVRAHRTVPPVYLRNTGYVGRAALFMGTLLLGAGTMILNTLAPYETFGGWFSVLTTPAVFVSALGIVLAHLTYAYRNYVRPRRYTEMSPDDVLWPVFCFTGLFAVLTIGWILTFTFAAAVILSATSSPGPVGRTVAGAILFGGFPLFKLWLEWIRFQAQHGIEPSGPAAWLVPSSLRSIFPE